MADISKIITPGGDEYNLKDATARAAATTMTGATASSNGTAGIVPAPVAGNQDKVLKGDGTWGSLIDALEVTSSLSMGRDATSSTGTNSTAVGYNVVASGNYSNAEGYNATASGTGSHAEGIRTAATGTNSHAEGAYTVASGVYSHSEGENTSASGHGSHAEGRYTISNHKAQHVFGEYNIEDASSASAGLRGNYIEIVGNGTEFDGRSNARTLDWNGNEWLAGDLTVGGERSVMGMVLTPASPISIPSTANSPISLNLEGLTAEHMVVAWRFSSSAENNPPCNLTITTYDGYFTVSNTSGTTIETIQPVFAIPTAVATTTHNT